MMDGASRTPHHVTTGKPSWLRPTALLASFVLTIGGIFLGQSVQAPVAEAQTPGLANEGFDPNWTKVDQLKANWLQPLTTESIYWTSDRSTGNPAAPIGSTVAMLGESYDFTDDATGFKTRPVLEFERTAAGVPFFDMRQFSTQAIAPIGGTQSGNDTLSVYFWSHDGFDGVDASVLNCPVLTGLGANQVITVARVTDQSPDIYVGCMPAPSMAQTFPPQVTGDGFATGGEGNQLNGLIYVQADYGSMDAIPATAGGPNTSWVQFSIWDPQTGQYSMSGPVQPADTKGSAAQSMERKRLQAITNGTTCVTGLESACAYGPVAWGGGTGVNVETAADFGLDAQGNIYIYVSTPIAAGAGQNGTAALVRINPATGDDGGFLNGSSADPWVYNVVKKLGKSDSTMTEPESAIWSPGTGIHDGKFLAGGYIGVNSQAYPANQGSADGVAASENFTASRMLRIDPLSGDMAISGVQDVADNAKATDTIGGGASTSYTMSQVDGRVYRDNASPQMLTVIGGFVYDDANADSVISDDEVGVADVTVAVYDEDNTLLGTQITAQDGSYRLIVSGDGTYHVRVLHPQIGGVNAVQTYGAVDGTVNEVTIHCGDSTITTGSGQCFGNLDPGYVDPELESTDSSSWPIWATVVMNSDAEVAGLNFGVSTLGSTGDAKAGPASVAASAPIHVNGGNPVVWLGDSLGANQVATDGEAHNDTDDGVFIDSAAGAIPLEGTLVAATAQYQLGATLSGDQADAATLVGWTTGTGSTWDTTAAWTTQVSDGVATGSYQVQPSGTVSGTPSVQLRAEVSTATITSPTNAKDEYQAAADSSATAWATPGEIEDYAFSAADAVYRTAVVNTGDPATFTVDGQSLTASAATGVVFGTAKAASVGQSKQITATAPSGARLSSVTVTDTATRQPYEAEVTTEGSTATVTFTPELGDDVLVQFSYGLTPDPTKSTLTIDNTATSAANDNTAEIGTDLTATATIVDAEGVPVPGVTVSFGSAAEALQLGDDTCVTNTDGVCSITVSSLTAGTYTDAVSATISVDESDVAISGSPKTVVFTQTVDPSKSSFEVTPKADLGDDSTWVVADGQSSYTGILTANDSQGRPVTGLTLTDIVFDASNDADKVVLSAVTAGATPGTYEVKFTSTTADADSDASVAYLGRTIGSAQPIPFVHGDPVPGPKPDCANGRPGTGLSVTSPVVIPASSAVTALVTDENCNPVPDVDVEFAMVTPGSSTLTVVNGTTGADGKATASVSDPVEETVTVRADYEHEGASEQVDDPKDIVFTATGPGPVKPGPFTCEDGSEGTNLKVQSPITLPDTGAGTSSVRALVTDENCVPVPDVDVEFTMVTPGSSTLTVVKGTTGADGIATATVSDAVAETVTIRADYDDHGATGQVDDPKDIVFVSTGDTTKPTPPQITTPTTGTTTNDDPIEVTGSGEPGATVTVVDETDGTKLCTATVTSAGTWSCAVSGLADGDHTLSATQTDPSNNTSDPSNSVDLTVDKTAPGRPTIDTANDEVIAGTVPAPVESGTTIDVTYPTADGEKTVSGVRVNPDGTWSTPTPEDAISGPVAAVATDPAGNESEPGTGRLDVDPSGAPDITTANDDVIAGTVPAPVEDGSTIDVTYPTADGDNTLTDVVVNPDGSWSVPTPDDAIDGEVSAVVTDPAGNVSPEGTGDLDVTAPGKPVIDTANDDVISGRVPTPIDSGTTVVVTDKNGDKVCETGVRQNGTWSCETPDDAVDGPIEAVATDPAGNDSEPGTGNLDTTAPGKPVIDTANDDVISGKVPTPVDDGTEVVVTYPKSDGTPGSVTVPVKPDGSWSVETPDDAVDGPIEAVATDPAGNDSEPGEGDLDRTPPKTPEVNDSNGSEISGDNGEPGDHISVTDPDGNPVPGCEDAVVGSDGHWSCTPTTPLAPGDEVTVVATDPAGNQSDPVTITIETLGIELGYGTRHPLEQQTVTGTNFNPGEKVCLVVQSDPIQIGCAEADAQGTVKFSFDVPAALAQGSHTATLTGDKSGSISAVFMVTDAVSVQTGGVVDGPPYGMLFMGSMMVVAGLALTVRRHGAKVRA
ncbi:MAG: Ig-like domain-containing protein [Propionibacteriaceae bacterium]|jgi:protocatechuate 3,4-dioxygenase beta subunit|nr:Ig-like domain-containing protein [Propionibacteriaceae bacterium]